jgi:succinyl-diaminopimelate desuccinylase
MNKSKNINPIQLLEKLISYKSITPDDDGAFDFIEEYLSDFEVIKLDIEDVKNRFFFKKFGDNPDATHLCFGGHIDVVPAGDLGCWDSNPFKLSQKDDFIYGRGTQDMKSGVSAFMYALKNSISSLQKRNFNGTISILLTSDEEGDAKYGTIEVLKYLKNKDFLPDFAIIAEPTCEEVFGDAIKVGRRGSINGKLKINGKQGHAAYPQKAINPVHQIASILPNIAGVNLDDGDEYFAPSQFVITDIRAGMQVTNVTPNDLNMMFNVRNSTKTTKEDIKKFINDNLANKDDTDKIDYELTLSQSAKPFVTNQTSTIVQNLAKAIKDSIGIDTKLSTAGGTSDARFFGEFGIDTVEFGVINDTIHSVNERTTISQVQNLTKIFQNLIEKF